MLAYSANNSINEAKEKVAGQAGTNDSKFLFLVRRLINPSIVFMKKITIMSMIPSVIFGLFSCKKNNTTPADNSFWEEYKMSPLDPIHHNWISSVAYVDEKGFQETITDISTFQNGVLNFKSFKKPFAAYISTTGNDMSSQEIEYSIPTSVNGDVKASNQAIGSPWLSQLHRANRQCNKIFVWYHCFPGSRSK